MVVIILKILKITGIVLLCILGTVLLLALLVLLLPVKYKISAVRKKDSPLNADFKLTYFFRALRAYVHYENELLVRVKVLWITLFEFKYPSGKSTEEPGVLFDFDDEDLDDEDLNDDADNSSDQDYTGSELDDSNDTDNKTNAGEDTSEEGFVDDVTEGAADDGNSDDNASEDDDLNDSSDSKASDDEENDFSESEDILTKLKYKVGKICDKIEKVRSEYRYYHNVINSNEAAYAYRNLKKRLFRILKKILPRRVHAGVIYGFDSPDITGKVYGLYCIFRNRFDKSSFVTPDFDKAVFEGEVFAKGHFNLWCIVYNLLCIALHPGSIKIYRSVRRHMKKNQEEETGGSKDAA